MAIRAFISIEIPDNIKAEIVKIQDSLPEFKGKKTEPENLHLTLKFLGEIEEKKVEEVKKRLKKAKVKKFKTFIDEAGIFDNRKSYKHEQQIIVWLHMTNCDELQKEIDNALSGLFELERRFMSHLTIARVKKVEDKKRFIGQIKKIKIPEMGFTVKDFRLKKSKLTRKGPEYEDLETYPLI